MIDEFVGKRLADKYEIEALIRQSDLGNVYRGRHLLMDKPVSIKILAPSLAIDTNIVDRFSAEARTISRLSHPNILNVTDFGRDSDGTVFIVMEEAEGETLSQVIKREGAFSVDHAVRVAGQIAAGLSSAHANLIAHHHLTSENVLLVKMANGSELVKVVDIGSFNAAGQEDLEDENSLKALSYLSPEQCSGESDADERSDIYSLGIIFFEMLVGEVPFTADNPTDLMLKHAEVPPPPFAAFRDDIPDEIEPILLRALAKNPDMRYQSVSAFAEDLNEAVRIGDPEGSVITSGFDAAAADINGNNNIWKTAFILLAGISLMAFGLIYWTKSTQTDPATVFKTDENGLPVQPLNPATGLNEQNLPNLTEYSPNSLDPNDPLLQSDVGGGGDGYDPWNIPGTPPGGSPSYQQVPLGGPTVTIPGNSGSIFTQDEPVGYDERGNPIYLIRRPVQNPSPTPKPSPTPVTDANSESPAAPPQASPKKTDEPKPVKTPEVKDSNSKPKVEPKKPIPAANSKQAKSGEEQDTDD